jgi:hypothetical protein
VSFRKTAKSDCLVSRVCPSLCPSVCPNGTTRHLLDRLSWNSIFEIFFWETVEKMQVSLKLDNNKGYFTWIAINIFIISRSVLLRMKNVSDERCREKWNAFFRFNNFCRKSCRLWDNVERYCRAEQATDYNMAHAHCMLDVKGYKYTHTHTGCAVLIFFPPQQW